jgi:hypothetical protein
VRLFQVIKFRPCKYRLGQVTSGYFKICKFMYGFVMFDQIRTNKVSLGHVWSCYVRLYPVRPFLDTLCHVRPNYIILYRSGQFMPCYVRLAQVNPG